jgi:hypothetical protein
MAMSDANNSLLITADALIMHQLEPRQPKKKEDSAPASLHQEVVSVLIDRYKD